MKTFIIFLFYSITSSLVAQDYYEIKTENHMVYNYPKNIDVKGTTDDGSVSKVILNKKYKEINIVASWSEKPEIYKNATITLVNRKDHYYSKTSKPVLLEKEIVKSSTVENTYTLKAVFSNGLLFEYSDGKVSAIQNDIELEIKNKYLVQTNEGLFKISFRTKTGEFWYVIEL